jgi:riboflavin biosynthesis pyrimidine reductase
MEPPALVAMLKREGYANLYVDGGATIQGFLRHGLIDELIITRVPVLLGGGVPLFGPLERDVPLSHMETIVYPDGLVKSRYRVER